jgi:hypothetical protein
LFWVQLADRGKELKALNTPLLGDSMLKADGTPWMTDLTHDAPKINWDDLTQIAALPLGSWLKTDPWDDRVRMLNAKRYAPMLAHDKMPMEVTPIYFRLQRYEQANANQPAAPGAPAQTQPADDPQGAPPTNQQTQPPAGGNQPPGGPQPTATAPTPTPAPAPQ